MTVTGEDGSPLQHDIQGKDAFKTPASPSFGRFDAIHILIIIVHSAQDVRLYRNFMEQFANR